MFGLRKHQLASMWTIISLCSLRMIPLKYKKLGVNQLIRSFRWKKPMLLSTITITTAPQFVGQTVDLALFNYPMHFYNNFLHFTLRESPIIRCDSCLYFKGIMRRKHKRMLVHVYVFCKPNIVNPLINQLDLNRPNAISTVPWVQKIFNILAFIANRKSWLIGNSSHTNARSLLRSRKHNYDNSKLNYFSIVLTEIIVIHCILIRLGHLKRW